MKEPKKAIKAIKYLSEAQKWLEMAYGDLPFEYHTKIEYIKDTLHHLSISDKVKGIKIAEKIKRDIDERES